MSIKLAPRVASRELPLAGGRGDGDGGGVEREQRRNVEWDNTVTATLSAHFRARQRATPPPPAGRQVYFVVALYVRQRNILVELGTEYMLVLTK